jgi:diketogulonate reductase-like aldo/keto reductase
MTTLAETQLVWRTLESYVPHQIKSLGISNVTLPMLKSLYESAKVKPIVVQNRFYPDTEWEVSLRKFCRDNKIVFESFWTLTANPQLIKSVVVRDVARELEKVADHKDDLLAISFYALVLGLRGVSILNGSTNVERMTNDLNTLALIEKLKRGKWVYQWEAWMRSFGALIRDYQKDEDADLIQYYED